MSRAAAERPFELGAWRVEPARGVLVSEDGEVRLEPRLMDLLLLFAASDGRVLSKDEIVARVWQGRAIGDDTLAAAVSRLRTALGDKADNRYIETVPKRGYRFLKRIAGAAREPDQAGGRAEQLLRQGETALHSPFPQGLVQAKLSFEQAIAAEPASARAHAGLAEALLAQHFAGAGAEVLPPARAAAQAAIGLDRNFARAWSVLGMTALLIDRDFACADEAIAQAVGLDPVLAQAHRHRAFAFASTGRFVEAEREARQAVELQPISLSGRGLLLQILIAARRYNWALASAGEFLAIAPQAAEAFYARGWANIFLGEERPGFEAFFRGLELWGLRPDRIAVLRELFAEKGFAAACGASADLFEEQGLLFQTRPTDIAILRTAAGQFGAALAALEKAAARDDPYLLLLPWLPHFDPLRQDKRFEAFLARIRLVR
jgi:DNA-binding winged helix-turn-helix (wHTH) protein